MPWNALLSGHDYVSILDYLLLEALTLWGKCNSLPILVTLLCSQWTHQKHSYFVVPLGKKYLLPKITYFNTYPTATSAIQIRRFFLLARGLMPFCFHNYNYLEPSCKQGCAGWPVFFMGCISLNPLLPRLMWLVIVTFNDRLSHYGCDKLKSLFAILSTSAYRKLLMPICSRGNCGCT